MTVLRAALSKAFVVASLAAGSCGADPPPESSVATFGARGDGRTDDTAALQAAIDAVPAGGTLRFPPGTYRIAADRGLVLKDDLRLELGDAVLTGPNVAGARCRLIEIQGRRNVTIRGGTLVGSRLGAPEWGVGILASDAEDLTIEGTTFREFFFDGILLTGNRGSRRVRIRNVTSQDNRRTGLAVPGATDVVVEDSTFLRSRGQDPQAGANCEPGPGSEVHQVRFLRSRFADNAGVGLYVHRGKGVTTDATIEDNEVSGNVQGIIVAGVRGAAVRGNRVRQHRLKGRSGIALGEDTTGVVVSGNVLEDNFRGIVSAGASGVQIRGNTVRGTGLAPDAPSSEDGDGIVCRGLKGVLTDACTIADNTVRAVAGSGIVAQLVSRVAVSGNRVEDPGLRGIYLAAVTGSEVRDNEVVHAGALGGRRYDAIELAASANDNLVTQNVCRLGPGTRSGILVNPGCLRNRVFANEEVPWSGTGG